MGKTLGYGEITVANMTEPFTVMLTNEAQQFATDSNRKVTSAQSYYTDIIVIRGSQERTDYTIGNITSGSGITVSKSSKRVTFSVSAGATIGADTGVIEIPITLDGQTVKKQFSWSCGKQGPQGVKGKDGTSVKITSKSVTYQTSTSGTTAPTGTWSTTVPTVNNGQYLWTKTTVQYSDGNKTEAYSVSYKGTNGTNGTSVTVSKTEVTYQVSTSGTTAPTGTWGTTMPSCDQGQYLWTKTYVKYSDGKDTTSYSVSYKGVDGEKFAFNMLRETNQGSKHWVNLGASGKYSVESITTDDNINAAKLICTEAIASNEWQFCDFSDYEMLKSLKASTTYTLSYDIKTNRSGKILHNIKTGSGQKVFFANDIACKVLGNETWEHVSLKMTSGTTLPNLDGQVIYMFGDALSKVGYSIIKNLKLTEGTVDTPWAPHPEDLEGRGVSETVQYYLATSQASGVTSSTSGWSTDITTQKLTADKKYLWNCYQTKYSDGTSEPISTPKVIGVYGDKGQKGDPGEDGQDGAGFYWNLLSGTKDLDKSKITFYSKATIEPTKYLDFTVVKATALASSYSDILKWHNVLTPTPNTTYTLSFYAKASVETYCRSHFYPSCTVKNISNYETTTASDGGVRTKLSTEWNRYSVTWTTSSSVSGAKSIVPIRLEHGNTADGATVYLCGIKLEQSDKPSPWCTTYEETLAKNLSITPSSQYFKSTDGGKTFAPDTITIKPTIQGEINFGKWQYSIDGGVSFADAVSGQKGLMISNNVLTVRKDSSLYSDAVTMVTFRAVANDSGFYDTCSIAKLYDVSDIGDGRNLLTGVSSYTKDTPFEKTDSRADGWTMYQNIITSIELEAGKKYVLQAKTDGNWAANHDINGQDPSKKLVTLWLCSDKTNNCFDMRQGYAVFTPTVTAKYKLRVNQYSNGTDAYTIHLWDIKLEKGSSPTGWTPAPEDLQTAILSTKSEISDVSLKVDKNKQAIEQRVEKTTYEQDLNLVKGDISKANEGLNKWRYEIYPKSLFASEYQGKSTMDVFAKNTNLTPSQSVLINDTDFGKNWAYGDNYIGYALTFVKFSAAKSVAITFKHDDGAHLYLNGKLIGGDDTCNIGSGESLTLSFIQGWNCLEVVLNEKSGGEYIGLGTTISAISECQLMNCYYGTPVARQSHITNQLVQNTTDIDGVTTTMQKVMTTVGGSDKIDEFVNNYNKTIESEKQFKKTIGETYTTKDEFNGLEIGGRNLLTKDDCNMSKWQNLYPVHCKVTNNDYSNHIDYVPTGGEWEIIYKKISVTKGQKYILSFDYKVNKAYNYLSGQKYGIYLSTSVPTNAAPANIIANGQYVVENTVTNIKRGMITFTATVDTLYIVINGGCIDDNQTGLSFEFNKWKLEKGNKATDWTPAPEDDEINGQNLVSNLPANWEQGTVTEGSATGTTYASTKSPSAGSIRPKELIPVSGNITISTAYSNQSKKPIRHWIAAYDVNKNYLGNNYVPNAWNSFPRTLNMKDAKYIAIMVGYTDSSAITPSDISQICLKIERGTSATPFTLAPEDVNGKIVNVETIANQTADKFSWIVKSGTSSSNFEITDRLMNLVSANINLDGIVSFMNTAKGDGRKNLYNLDYSSFENVASQEDAICYAKDNGVTSVGIDSSVSYDGDKSLKISYTTANLNSSTTPLYLGSSTNNYGCVKIQAGKQYILSCYVKSDSTTGMFMIDIQGHDTPDTKTNGLYLSNIDPRKLPGSSTGVNLSTDWQRAVCAIKVADNATGLYWSVVPLIWGKPSSSNVPQTFNVWVDCIMLEEVDSISNEPGTYILDKETIIDGGSVKADTITGNQILAGSITADKIATDAIKSHNYISSGGTQGSFLNLGDGSFTSPNLSWDSNGNLIAKNANIIGNLTAGTVGEWKIDKYIYSRDKMFFDINKHNGQSIYNKNSTNNLFLGDGKVSSFYWFTTQNNTFIIENGNSPQYATGPAGISFGTNIAQGQIELYESVYPGNIIQDYEQTSHTSELSISGSKISFSYYDSNGSSFSDSPYTYIMADYARFYGDIFVQGSITTDEGVDVGGKLQASSIATKNGGLIETAGTVYGGGEIQCGGGQMRIIGGNYGILLRNDGSDFYILSTDSGSPWGSWNSKRPFRINLANGIPYFEYGIIIPNENYLLGNGYQLARGTSWGGVCIGDDSKRLRLYGTSIWASHSISTSDENLKENFTTLDQYEEFYMNLNPIGFNYIGDYDGKKTHFGFGAHKIEDILESEGYDADKFAVVTHRPLVQEDIEKRFGKDVTVDIETEYGVSYAEFIALNTHMIQKTRRELTKVKQEKADLEARLQIIEAKLGL